MWSLGRGSPRCKAGIKIILVQRRPHTSPEVAQLIVSSEFTVIGPGRLSQHLLSSCSYYTSLIVWLEWWNLGCVGVQFVRFSILNCFYSFMWIAMKYFAVSVIYSIGIVFIFAIVCIPCFWTVKRYSWAYVFIRADYTFSVLRDNSFRWMCYTSVLSTSASWLVMQLDLMLNYFLKGLIWRILYWMHQ